MTELSPKERLEVLFEEMAELAGQRNAIDGRPVQITAELDHDDLCGITGARSMPVLIACKLGGESPILSPPEPESGCLDPDSVDLAGHQGVVCLHAAADSAGVR